MSGAFTPGPWFAGKLVLADDDDDFGTISIGQQDLSERSNKDAHYEDTIAEVWQNPNLSEDAEANAALITAAPELYDANEYAVTTLREMAAILRGNGLPGCAQICDAAAAKSEAALAKARAAQ